MAAVNTAEASGILILLGAPNDHEGHLSTIARERCDRVVLEHASRPAWDILPTGGFGKHDNEAVEPHYAFSTRYLIERGITGACILEGVASANTFEDAQLTADRLRPDPPPNVIVVTSDFHVPRATILFQRVLPSLKLSFVGSKTNLPEAELLRLRTHEENAIARLSS